MIRTVSEPEVPTAAQEANATPPFVQEEYETDENELEKESTTARPGEEQPAVL